MDPMTGAYLKSLREYLGLSAQWCADAVSVQQRSWVRWEDGVNPIPDDVAAWIREQRLAHDAAVTALAHREPPYRVSRTGTGASGRPAGWERSVAIHAATLAGTTAVEYLRES